MTRVKIYTIEGRLVKTINEADFGNSGYAEWNVKNEIGEGVALKIYITVIWRIGLEHVKVMIIML